MKESLNHHLAQVNIANLLKPLDHPQIAEFVDNLDKINAVAEQSDGFVWRLKDESGNATDIQIMDDPMLIINMSVWESVASLKRFVYHSDHFIFYKKKRKWFKIMKSFHMALWWIPKSHIPSVEEAKDRLNAINERGDTEYAFSFRKFFKAPTI